jgi:adenine phosphoribosyltransferase
MKEPAGIVERVDFKEHIRSVGDYPKPGIMFRDITTLLGKHDVLKAAAESLAALCEGKGIEKVAVVESRGFLLGGVIAYLIGAGLVILRKKGKLPHATHAVEYGLEYGTDVIEIHQDAILPGERVWLHDDLIATGGTVAAAGELVRRCGGDLVGASFLVELAFLPGRRKLLDAGFPEIHALVSYDDESA